MELKEVVGSQRQWIFDVRRALHKIPEVAFCEEKTSGFVAGCLRELGLEVRTGVARWGGSWGFLGAPGLAPRSC
ncbi:MAG: hypothetical protein WHX93_11975 [bacterium]